MQTALRALAGALPLVLTLSTPAQDRFATSIVSFNQGTGTGIFDTNNLLGGPRGEGLGNGSLHVLTLGNGGDVTVGFDVTITDGPGADLLLSENPFVFGGGVYAEVFAVEVSTNGVDYARFPTRYSGPPGPLGAFEALPFGTYAGLSGGMPVAANVDTNVVDPFDPVVAGGDAFDLAELSEHPAVVGGQVDLSQIHFVRLVDVVAGTLVDERGVTIWDSGGDSSADVDSVAVIQHAGNQDAGAPIVDLWRDTAGFVHLRLEDPDGFADIDPSQLRVSVNLIEVPFFRLRDYFVLQSSSPEGLHLVAPHSSLSLGLEATLAVSARDQAGNFSADQISMNR